MRLLAIETASGSVGVALVGGSGEVLAEVSEPAERHHVEVLHPAIEAVCARAGLALPDVDAVGVDVGPGLFTGIRVGVAAAKGIAMALGCPAVGVTSLEAIGAAAEPLAGGREIVPVVDLRRGEVAWLLSGSLGWGTAEELAGRLTAGNADEVVFAGDGALRYAEMLGPPDRPGWRVLGQELASAPVSSVAALCLASIDKGLGADAVDLEPCYLREADARINWTTRHDGPADRGA